MIRNLNFLTISSPRRTKQSIQWLATWITWSEISKDQISRHLSANVPLTSGFQLCCWLITCCWYFHLEMLCWYCQKLHQTQDTGCCHSYSLFLYCNIWWFFSAFGSRNLCWPKPEWMILRKKCYMNILINYKLYIFVFCKVSTPLFDFSALHWKSV